MKLEDIKDKGMVFAHRWEFAMGFSLPEVRWAPTEAGLGGGSNLRVEQGDTKLLYLETSQRRKWDRERNPLTFSFNRIFSQPYMWMATSSQKVYFQIKEESPNPPREQFLLGRVRHLQNRLLSAQLWSLFLLKGFEPEGIFTHPEIKDNFTFLLYSVQTQNSSWNYMACIVSEINHTF